jgi:hypothetical protein
VRSSVRSDSRRPATVSSTLVLDCQTENMHSTAPTPLPQAMIAPRTAGEVSGGKACQSGLVWK